MLTGSPGDEAQVDAYLADPYCQYQSTVSMFEAMMGGLQYIAKRENLARMAPSTPVYFFSGDQDPVGGMGKGVKKTWWRCSARPGAGT